MALPVDLDSLRVRDGTVDVNEDALLAAATDFGHVVNHVPLAVVRPGSVDDVVTVVRWAAKHRIPLAARGAGHSMNGQAQVPGGIVVDMTSLCTVHSVARDRVVVDGGVYWSTVLSATLPVGLVPPILTDYLELTVGGTISVGGVGGMSFRYGAVTDNILELDVVTGDGQLRTCSPTRNRGLFGVVCAGFGQYGLIVRATLRLVSAHSKVRYYRLGYDDLRAFTADQRRLITLREPAYIEGYAKITEDGQKKYELELATYDSSATADKAFISNLMYQPNSMTVEELGYTTFLERLAPGVAARKESGEWWWPHPWLNMFLPDSAVDTFLDRSMAEFTAADLENFGIVLTYPIPTSMLRTPLMRLPDERITFLVAFLLTADIRDASAADRIIARAQRHYEQAKVAGGFLYPIGVPSLTPAQWPAHYGSVWQKVVAGKNSWDPERILTPGPGIVVS